MSHLNQADKSNRVYRLDRFLVPAAAREEFLSRVQVTHEILRRQHGFLQDFLIEQKLDSGDYAIATLVEWDSQATVERAVPVVKAAHERMGFNPGEFIARLGIKPEIGFYRAIEERQAIAA